MGKATRKTIIDFFADMDETLRELSTEEAGLVYIACARYCASGEVTELDEKAKIVFLMLKRELDAEKAHIDVVSKNRSHKKTPIADNQDENQMVPNGTKWYQMVSKEPNGSAEKESTLSPLSPPSLSPTPPITTPPIIPQTLIEKNSISLVDAGHPGGVKPRARKTQDHYGSLSEFQRSRFDTFWKAYPKKSTKQECAAWWNENKPDDELLNAIIRGVESYKRSSSVANGYALDPIRFLKRRRWDDEITLPVTEAKPRKTDEEIAAERAAYQREIELSERNAPRFI